MTQAYLLERYGPRLGTDQLAEVLGITKHALYQQVSKDICKVKTYIDSGKRYCDYRDLAAYLDEVRQQAA